jgi:hypothetical protein
MSGRLIILSKKGYCSWNAQNLTRLRRDEKEHQVAQEREREKQANIASTSRLVALKRTRHDNDIQQKRFCLFESEEKASFDMSKQLEGSKSEAREGKNDLRNEGRTSKNEEKKSDDCPYHYNQLGCHSLKNRDTAKSFYLNERSIKEPVGRKEMQRKREMDPMRDFHEAEEGILHGISHGKMVQSIKSDRSVGISQREKRKRKSSQNLHSDDSSSGRGDIFAKRIKEDKHKKKKKRRHREDCQSHHSEREISRSKKKISSRSINNKSDDIDSTEELRKKRAEREEQERQRQDALLQTAQNFDEDKHRKNERRWDQFHSTCS